MNVDQVLKEFKKSGALLTGHYSSFSSGLHSDMSCKRRSSFRTPNARRNCARRSQKIGPQAGEGEFTANRFACGRRHRAGYEMGRQLGVPPCMSSDRTAKFTLRRNFHLAKNQPVLMVEDIISTGVSSRECLEAIREAGRQAGRCLLPHRRSNGAAKGRRQARRARHG